MYWSAKLNVVISKIARPCVNGSGALSKVLWYVEVELFADLQSVSAPPIVRIWLPPTALQLSPRRGF